MSAATALALIGLVKELQSPTCRCGREKRLKQTFCKPCFRYLPPDVQQGLYLRIGSGYEEAHRQANQILLFRPAPHAGYER
jgi:hypothetical protein